MGTFVLNRSSRSNRLIIKLGGLEKYLLTYLVGCNNLIYRIKGSYSVAKSSSIKLYLMKIVTLQFSNNFHN